MIVAGFGFRKSATAASLLDAYARSRGGAVAELFATLDAKAGSQTFLNAGLTMGIAAKPVTLTAAQGVVTLTNSEASVAAHGVGSVAEAAAMAAAGPGAKLLAPRSVSADGMATCALAEGQSE